MIRGLVSYARQCLCKHDWLVEEAEIPTYAIWSYRPIRKVRVSKTCKKCGWHRKYWKY